jgi:hypothetical protein
MRAVPACRASKRRELCGPESRRGGLRVRQSASPLCIAGAVLQITETTEKKLSANPVRSVSDGSSVDAEKADAEAAKPSAIDPDDELGSPRQGGRDPKAQH